MFSNILRNILQSVASLQRQLDESQLILIKYVLVWVKEYLCKTIIVGANRARESSSWAWGRSDIWALNPLSLSPPAGQKLIMDSFKCHLILQAQIITVNLNHATVIIIIILLYIVALRTYQMDQEINITITFSLKTDNNYNWICFEFPILPVSHTKSD